METFIQNLSFSSEIPKIFAPFLQRQFPWEMLDHLQGFFSNLSIEKNAFLENLDGVFLEHSDLIWMGKDVTIEKGAYIKGPVYLGDGTTIRSGAYVRENSIFMENNLVGHSSEVKSSIFFPSAKAPHFNYVGDSILGRDVNLGAGAVLSNYRLDQKTIEVAGNDGPINTKRKKLGAILGDHVQVGCHAVLNPGTIVGNQSVIYPQTCTKGVHPTNSIIK